MPIRGNRKQASKASISWMRSSEAASSWEGSGGGGLNSGGVGYSFGESSPSSSRMVSEGCLGVGLESS